jgi:peroxiredoxin
MRSYLKYILFLIIFSCNEKKDENTLLVKGNVKNAGPQKVYLEEVYFVQKPPQILDTADVKDGKFQLTTVATELGLFRIRLDDGKEFFFINDQQEVQISGDATDPGISKDKVNTPATNTLYKFINWMESRGKELNSLNAQLQDKLATAPKDSSTQVLQQQLLQKMNASIGYVKKFIDTVSNPVVGMFALGFLDDGNAAQTREGLASLKKRFPNHKGLAELELQLTKALDQQVSTATKPSIGQMAPDLTMNDVNGKPVALSSFKGKYLLVDFWASWCGPCRQENPNVVNAYNRFKEKNFTVLGVSLDQDKTQWLQAIKDDGLVWTNISDLLYWESKAVGLYGIEGIPYNVLLDPTGKIIATDLRGEMLEQTLNSVLK